MNAQRKLQQAKYHLEEMKKYSGKQDEYMFNLVSFIQSAREITWYLQKEFKNDPKKHSRSIGGCPTRQVK